MPPVSMSQIVDFMLTTGPARATEARSHGGQPFDLYAEWKATVINRLARGEPLGTPAEMWTGLDSDPKKAKRYPVLLDGMKRWIAKGLTGWPSRGRVYAPEPVLYPIAPGLAVRVNPEIGFIGERGAHMLCKLWLRTEPLAKARAEMLIALMAEAHPEHALWCSVLDVARVSLHTATPAKDKAREVVRAEALAYAALRGGR
jgi:hypothetical protein